MALSSHASRWLVAAIAAPILLGVIFLAPPVALTIVVLLAGGMAWYEYYSACFEPGRPVLLAVCLIGWLAVALGAFLAGGLGQRMGLFAAVALGGIYFLARYKESDSVIDQVARMALGHGYLSLFTSFFIVLFALPHGPRWVLFTLLVTMLGDTMAFYTGRSLGRTPLYPAVSPKKTWEGLLGGVAASGLTASIYAAALLPTVWYEAGLLGLFLGFWAAIGDLFESMLKRAAGVKDSGALLMGHGGLWDRLDALIFNVPVIYLFALVRAGG